MSDNATYREASLLKSETGSHLLGKYFTKSPIFSAFHSFDTKVRPKNGLSAVFKLYEHFSKNAVLKSKDFL